MWPACAFRAAELDAHQWPCYDGFGASQPPATAPRPSLAPPCSPASTSNVAEALLPALSVAVHVTVVRPTGKELPEGGSHATVGWGVTSSVALTAKSSLSPWTEVMGPDGTLNSGGVESTARTGGHGQCRGLQVEASSGVMQPHLSLDVAQLMGLVVQHVMMHARMAPALQQADVSAPLPTRSKSAAGSCCVVLGMVGCVMIPCVPVCRRHPHPSKLSATRAAGRETPTLGW
jgi:hypothetical protein